MIRPDSNKTRSDFRHVKIRKYVYPQIDKIWYVPMFSFWTKGVVGICVSLSFNVL